MLAIGPTHDRLLRNCRGAGVLLAFLAGTIVTCPAQTTIGLDFVGGQSGDTSSMATTESAGVVAQTNWNDLTSNSGTSSTIKNNSGTTIAGASVTYTSTNTWSDTGVSNTAGNNRMMRGYLDINTSGASTTVSVSGLSSLGYYDVYVYTAGDGNNRTGKFTIGNQSYWVNDNATFAGTFTRGTGQVDPGSYSNATAGNYMVFSDLTGNSVSLTATGAYAADGTLRAPVNGIQIVQLPTSYWDINGATAGAGGSGAPAGTWSTAATNWSSSSAGTVATGSWTAGNLAVFSAGTDATSAYTVTVSGTQTASSIIVEEGSPTFSGGTIALNGTTPQINVASGSTAVVNSQISSTAGLTKTGAGTLVVGSTANAYTGPTVVQTGTLKLGASNVIPNTSAVIVQSGATLNLNNYSDTVGSLAGSGIITLGSGTLTVGNDNTSTTFSGSFTSGSTGTFAKTGSGTLTFGAGMNLASGTLMLSGGTLNLGGFSSTFNSLSVTANSTLDFGTSGSSILNLTSLSVASGVTLTIANWTNAVDYFYSTNNPIPGLLGHIVFSGFTSSDTKWMSYDTEVTPVPEPSTYGAILLSAMLAFAGYRRLRTKRSPDQACSAP
ncbi:MAG TPA: autotransporter-associated beta strand repeat-containing protein [Opitutaceae bacterium]|nr:autotransporter-associated beta strand repeat-containing protein [Opitutaceae bacterium]